MFLEQACFKFISHLKRGMASARDGSGRRRRRRRRRGGGEEEEGGEEARSTSAGNNGDDNKTGGKPVRGTLNGWSHGDVTASRSHED